LNSTAVWKQPLLESRFWLDASRRLPHARPMTFTKNIGMLLLAIYLILVGLIGIFGFYFGVIPGIIALLAGIFIILGR
jgi:hypothetical protein